MADRWIIVSRAYYEHRSIATAQAELKRLQNENPKVKFRLIRIKTTIEDDKVRKPRR